MFGFGERFSALNQVGKRPVLWNCDACYHGYSADAELWRAYKNVPIINSSKGYMLYINTSANAFTDIGFSDKNKNILDFAGKRLDLFFWAGDPLQNIVKYTDFTGKPVLPPKWAYRYMAGGGNAFWYGEDWGANPEGIGSLEILEKVVDGYIEMGTPDIAALYGEGPISTKEKAYDILKKTNTRMLNWNPPDLPIEKMREYLPGTPDEDLPRLKLLSDPTKDEENHFDFSMENSSTLLNNQLKKWFDLGLRGGMIDFAEYVPEDAVDRTGMTGEDLHNYFCYGYGKRYAEACRNSLGDDFIIYQRGACAGSQKWCANFSGDQFADWWGLKQQVIAGLSMAASGFSVWGGDLGGYEGKPSDEVFCRGMQLSTMYPLMRAHGTRTRCPWDFGEKGIAAYKLNYWFRENLLDFIYSNAIESHKNGTPMMRPFAMEFPNETSIAAIDDEYIFCNDILVGAVFKEGQYSRKMRFPNGRWFGLWEGDVLNGGQDHKVQAPFDRLPLYLKSGSIIPVKITDDLEFGKSMLNTNTVDAVVITPPEFERQFDYNTDANNSVRYMLNAQSDKIVFKADDNNQASRILLYASAIKSVYRDGVELEKISGYLANESGYWEAGNGRTGINLGDACWSVIEINY